MCTNDEKTRNTEQKYGWVDPLFTTSVIRRRNQRQQMESETNFYRNKTDENQNQQLSKSQKIEVMLQL